MPLRPSRMLEYLQNCVAAYYERDDAWPYKAYRAIFDQFSGAKREEA